MMPTRDDARRHLLEQFQPFCRHDRELDNSKSGDVPAGPRGFRTKPFPTGSLATDTIGIERVNCLQQCGNYPISNGHDDIGPSASTSSVAAVRI